LIARKGLLRRKGRPVVAFDPQGVIFAGKHLFEPSDSFQVATATNVIKLYDLKSYDKGPFSSFQVNHAPGKRASKSILIYCATVEWTGLKFSPDGKHMLLSTTSNAVFLVDAFSGDLKQTYTSFSNSANMSIEASFSPDGQFVLSGSDNGTIHLWETLTGKRVSIWRGHTGAVTAVQWNPKKVMAATADQSLAFWIPVEQDETQ
jgi:COMPASS component SWD2